MAMGKIYKQKNMIKDAMKCYQKILEVNATDSLSHANLGALYLQRGNFR